LTVDQSREQHTNVEIGIVGTITRKEAEKNTEICHHVSASESDQGSAAGAALPTAETAAGEEDVDYWTMPQTLIAPLSV